MNPRGSRLCFPGWTMFNRMWELDNPKCVFDLGANDGGMLANFIGRGAFVHAFEPAPYLAEQLRLRYSNADQCFINQLAVSDTSEMLRDCNFYLAWMIAPKDSVVAGMGGACEEPVKSDTFDMNTIALDEYIGTMQAFPDFIKMDVDGYEYRALKGMRNFLAIHTPPMLFEFSYLPTLLGDSIVEMCRFIYELGYVAVSMDGLFCCETWEEMVSHCPEASSYDVMLLPRKRLAEFGVKTQP